MHALATKKTFRAVYDNGELILAEPIDIEGCWRVEVTFLEREDTEAVPVEPSPHRPEMHPVPDRIDEYHRSVDEKKMAFPQIR